MDPTLLLVRVGSVSSSGLSVFLSQVRGGSGDDAADLHREAGGDGGVAAPPPLHRGPPGSAGQ